MPRTALVLLLLVGACSSPQAPPPADLAPQTGATSPAPTAATSSPAPDSVAAPEQPHEQSPAEPSPTETTRRSASRAMWVAVEGRDELVLVDLDTGEVIERHEAPGGPHNLTVAPNGIVAAALYATTNVALVRDGEIQIVELGGRPHDVKPGAEGFVVANEAGRRIDTIVDRTGDHVGSVELRAEPHDLDLTSDGRTAWVTLNGTDELARLDLASGEVAYIATGKSPHDIRVAPDGDIWVTDWGGPLHVLSPEGEVETTIRLGREAHHLAFTPDGSELWVVDHATLEAYVVDTATREVVATIGLPGAPHHVAFTPDGRLAATVDHTNGTVLVHDVATRQLVRTIPVGHHPHGIWPAP